MPNLKVKKNTVVHWNVPAQFQIQLTRISQTLKNMLRCYDVTSFTRVLKSVTSQRNCLFSLKAQSWSVKYNVDVCQVNCQTVKLNVVINFDFWEGWNSIQVKRNMIPPGNLNMKAIFQIKHQHIGRFCQFKFSLLKNSYCTNQAREMKNNIETSLMAQYDKY